MIKSKGMDGSTIYIAEKKRAFMATVGLSSSFPLSVNKRRLGEFSFNVADAVLHKKINISNGVSSSVSFSRCCTVHDLQRN